MQGDEAFEVRFQISELGSQKGVCNIIHPFSKSQSFVFSLKKRV